MENIVVIGGGLMGSATAWELSKAGENILLLEQQDSVYSYGSSFGQARISRTLGEKDDIFSYLQQMSVNQTQELIDFLNRTSTGHSMEDIYQTAPVTYLYYLLEKNEAEALLNGQNIRTEYADNSTSAYEKFGMRIPDSMSVIREFAKYSGTLNPGVLISKLHQAIQQKGGRVQYNEKVISVRRDMENDGYQISVQNTLTRETRTIHSRKVVSAAGPYTGLLLKDIAPYFNELITPKRLFLAFFKPDSTAYFNLSSENRERLKSFYPVADISLEIFYSMIEKFDRDGLPMFKVGGHNLRTDVDNLDEVWKKELTTDEIEWSIQNTVRYLRMLDIPLDSTHIRFHHGYSCVYSLTDSEVPYVTNIIDKDGNPDQNFIVVGGMSGIGAKGSLAYGLIASNLLLGKTIDAVIYEKTTRALGFERLMHDKTLAGQ